MDCARAQIIALHKRHIYKHCHPQLKFNNDKIVKVNNINGLRQSTNSLHFMNDIYANTAILNSSSSLPMFFGVQGSAIRAPSAYGSAN